VKLHRYPEYKNSGLPWVGEIPGHWETMRARYLFREVDRRSVKGEETHLSMSQAHGLVPSKGLNRKSLQSESYAGGKLVAEDDLVLNRLKAHLGVFARARQSGVVSPDYSVFRPSGGASVSYCERLFKTPLYVAEFRRRTKGIVEGFWRLYTDDFYSVRVLLPPKVEQDKIVTYLRVQDAHFARFIKAKRDLIALLTEQRLRVIDDVVMNGLNRSVVRKPSGIDWLDDVPEHWSVVRLRTLTSSITSGSRGWSDHAADSGPMFLRVGNLSRGTLDLKLAKTVRLDLPEGARTEAARTRVQEGDILLSITAYIGSVGLVPKDMGESYVSQHVARCRLRPNSANPKWVAYVLLSRVGQAHGTVCMYGGTKQGLSLSDVKNHVMLLPPSPEQDELVQRIERETAVIDSLIAAAKLELDRVREYRECLIADAVTGQIDLRAWTPSPDDLITEEDLTALDDDDDNDTTKEETHGDDGHD
jgi:type I restriction enzyme S subunit